MAVFSVLIEYAYINDRHDTNQEELGLDLLQFVRVQGTHVHTVSLPAMKFIQIVVLADHSQEDLAAGPSRCCTNTPGMQHRLTKRFAKAETAAGTSGLSPNMHFKTSGTDKRQIYTKKSLFCT